MIDAHIQGVSSQFIDLARAFNEPLLKESFNSIESVKSLEKCTFEHVFCDLDCEDHRGWHFFAYGFSSKANIVNSSQNISLLAADSSKCCSIHKVACINPCTIELKELEYLSRHFVGFHFKPSWVDFVFNNIAHQSLSFIQEKRIPLFIHMDFVYALKPLFIEPRHFINRLLSEYPDLMLILEHCGGGIFMAELYPPYRDKFSRTCYSTAVPASPSFASLLIQCVPSGKIVFGSDYPFCCSLKPFEFCLKLKSMGIEFPSSSQSLFSSWFDL